MTELVLTDNFSLLLDQKADQRTGDLGKFQNESFEQFAKLGLPKAKTEAYKFTPIERILEKNFTSEVISSPSSWTKESCQAKFYPIEEANHLAFVNGQYNEAFSIVKSEATQLQISVIGEEEVKTLGKVSNQALDTFAQLNGSLFEKGLYLTAVKNKESLPVYIYQFLDENSYSFPRILINGEEGCSLNVYEKTFVAGEKPSFVCSIVEATVAKNADVRFTKLQNYSKSLFTVEGIYATQERDSRFYTNTYSFNGGLIRNNIVIDINGENCEGHMNGLYQISGKTHVDNNTSVDHKAPNSFSNELYKGVLDENARGVFNGKIYVRREAQKTNAFQSNNNILLSDTAIINTKPQLEIWADDVKCSHGCTTGQLDEEAIFYLRARGISKTRAKALLLNAFAGQTLAEVKSAEMTEEIQEIILQKLG
jgi:Fe-S cluster assembly protein SufD